MILIAAFFVLGAVIGGQINHAIYRFAFFSNPPFSPWMKPHPEAGQRSIVDYIPIIGWCFLNREEKIHGSLFWLRPLLIELVFGAVVAWLYYFHVETAGFVPAFADIPNQSETTWCWFIAHVVLLTFLTIATFVDFDEFMIPDQATIPGVLFCLTFAAFYPVVGLPDINELKMTEPMTFASPDAPPVVWYGTAGLVSAIACLWFWCFALIPKVCTFRKGMAKFLPLMLASIFQTSRKRKGTIEIAPRRMYWGTPVLFVIAILGAIAMILFWFLLATGPQKISLLTSVFGMAFGMSMIWSIRIIGRMALGKEAMGFGDVTLMAMIGAYVGWQACLPVLALSALVALIVSVPMAIIKSENTLPYGPYLSIGTVMVIFGWHSVWAGWLKNVFSLFGPHTIFLVLVIMTIPMFVLLVITRFVKERLIGIS